jgi:hypothetical protein
MMQVFTFLTVAAAFLYAIAVLYGITDFGAVANSTGSFPLAEAYAQATNGNNGATFGLLFIIFISLLICLVGTFLTVSRRLSLSRVSLTPLVEPYMVVIGSRQCDSVRHFL